MLCVLCIPANRGRFASADLRTPQRGGRTVYSGGAEVVLPTGDVAEFQSPGWSPQFEPWYTPSTPDHSVADVPVVSVTPCPVGNLCVVAVAVTGGAVVTVLQPGGPLSVDLSAIPTYDVSVDVLSPFVSPTPTAAAACVIAGLYRKGSIGNFDAEVGATDRQRAQDDAVSRDVLVGEALPVVRLRHLAAIAPFGVCVLDVRQCSASEHASLAATVRRLARDVTVLHRPANLLRSQGPDHRGSSASTPQRLAVDIELVLSDRETSEHMDRSLSEAFRYTRTGGLDVEMMNLAVGRPGGDPICQVAIASSMQHRAIRNYYGGRPVSKHFALVAQRFPDVAAYRGQCVAFFAGADVGSLVFVRDVLLRAGFVSVCGLSHTFMFAASLDET